jgi:transposase
MLCNHLEDPTAIRTQFGAIFVSLELSRKTWLMTSLSPGNGEKMSKRGVAGGDVAGLLSRFAELRRKAAAQGGTVFPIIVIQEAGLDGFWLHRLLEREGFESHVVDPASIAVPRRRRRAKTDKIDGEALLRARKPALVLLFGRRRNHHRAHPRLPSLVGQKRATDAGR